MIYVQIGEDGYVTALTEAEENPDVGTWVESPWGEIPANFDDYRLVDGELVLEPRDLPPVPFGAEQVLASLLQQTDVLDALPDDALEHMAPYMAGWQADASYAVGDMVRHGDRPYRCLQPHTSQVGWEPSNAPSLWARILGGQDGQVAEWEQPDSTNPYMMGDKVTHNGHTWESEVDNNVWEPGVYGWKQLD